MKKTYLVVALSVGGLGNKIFHSGETVQEGNFPEGNADKLVKQGFLKVIESGDNQNLDNQPNGDVDPNDPLKPSADLNSNDNSSLDDAPNNLDPNDPLKDINDGDSIFDKITEKELKDDLIARKISFSKKATKKELYDLWVK